MQAQATSTTPEFRAWLSRTIPEYEQWLARIVSLTRLGPTP